MDRISILGKSFIDEYQRQRIFNGVNIVYKQAGKNSDGKILYNANITEEEVKQLKDRGVNVIRAGLTWAGTEPERGKYNVEYLNGFRNTLKLYEKYGIYALVDFHQDLYCSYGIVSGDGAPRWACTGDFKSRKPLLLWDEGYFFDNAVAASFDSFWNNCNGIQDSFLKMLTFTSDYLKNCNNIIGYDVFNEPYPGKDGQKAFWAMLNGGLNTLAFSNRINRKQLLKDILNSDFQGILKITEDKKVYHSVIDRANLYIKKFDEEKYYPFIEKAHKAIQLSDNNTLIFFENCYYSNTGIPCSFPEAKDLVFSPHGYDLTVDTPLTNTASPERVDIIFDSHKQTQDRLSCPVLVGEWGGMVSGSDSYPALEHILDIFDRNMWSQTYWHYFSGITEGKLGDTLFKTYPQAVSGRIRYYKTDRHEHSFTLSYNGSEDIKAPTVIYLSSIPKAIYSTLPYKFLADGTLKVEAGPGSNIIKIEF